MSQAHHINIPQAITKQLKIQNAGNGKNKLTISSNWLVLFGFEAGLKTVEELIGEGEGIRVRLAEPDEDGKTKKVYQRTYKSRRNNPIETMLDIRSQNLLDKAFGDTKAVHITFTHGEILIRPILDKQAERMKKAKLDKELSAFVACSSGMDGKSLYDNGFRIDALCEYRPIESRDKSRDLSETGALCFLDNIPVHGTVFNEDIFNIDVQQLKEVVDRSGTTLFSISTQCDDMSNVKAKSLKEKSLCDLTAVNDMVFEALEIVKACQFPFVLLENVPGILNSELYTSLFNMKLRKWGYSVYTKVMDSSLHGGATKRKRAYIFASTFPDVPFSFPNEVGHERGVFWDTYVAPYLNGCRDVSHSKSIQDGKECGRLRVVNKESKHFPTLLKSQSRMAKDSLVIEHEGRFYFPSEELERVIMGVPDDFSLEAVSKSIGSEVLGQGIEMKSHSSLLVSIKEHIQRATRPRLFQPTLGL